MDYNNIIVACEYMDQLRDIEHAQNFYNPHATPEFIITCINPNSMDGNRPSRPVSEIELNAIMKALDDARSHILTKLTDLGVDMSTWEHGK